MILYHATTREYKAGQIVVADSPCIFYPEAVSALEQARPAGAPSRTTCLFAADNPEFSYHFALKQNYPAEEIRIYEVEITTYHKAPMALVHAIYRRLEKSGNATGQVSEYWEPTLGWKFYEYFGPEMRIIGEVAKPSINEIMMMLNYDGDFSRAQSL